MVKIINLAKRPDLVNQVVEWLYDEWGDRNFNFWDNWVRSSLLEDVIPQTYIVLVDGKLAGTASIWRCDLQSRQDLFPWFGGLYVSSNFRGKEFNGEKLGSLLIKHCINVVKKMNYKEAFLFTEKDTNYYERFGWKFIGYGFNERDERVKLYKILL